MKILDDMIRPNPAYWPTQVERENARNFNRGLAEIERITGKPMKREPVPRMVSRHLPHIGRKEMARHAGKTTLGTNASRALQPA